MVLYTLKHSNFAPKCFNKNYSFLFDIEIKLSDKKCILGMSHDASLHIFPTALTFSHMLVPVNSLSQRFMVFFVGLTCVHVEFQYPILIGKHSFGAAS